MSPQGYQYGSTCLSKCIPTDPSQRLCERLQQPVGDGSNAFSATAFGVASAYSAT